MQSQVNQTDWSEIELAQPFFEQWNNTVGCPF